MLTESLPSETGTTRRIEGVLPESHAQVPGMTVLFVPIRSTAVLVLPQSHQEKAFYLSLDGVEASFFIITREPRIG